MYADVMNFAVTARPEITIYVVTARCTSA